MNKRRVKYVRFHDMNIVVDKVGTIQKELPMQNKTIKGLEMYDNGTDIEIVIPGAKPCFVPKTNVQFGTYEE